VFSTRMPILPAIMLCGAAVVARAEPRPPHPEPRVIVNVLRVRGPHARDEVERSARLGWGRIVSCYKASDAPEKVVVTLELVVSGNGTVTRARRVRSPVKDRELADCLASAMQRLGMPKARARSTATVEIRLAPGDPPEAGAGEARD